jgi:ABC-2 type transport system permease protein
MSEVLPFVLPGLMFFWVMFLGQGPLQEVLHEKETHILPRILASPVTITQFVLAKLVRCFLLCGLVLLVLALASGLLFGMRWGNPLKLAAVVAACAFSITGMLALIYSLAKTREQANMMSSVVLLILALLGGNMFPFENLPAIMQSIGHWLPNRWGVVALQGLLRAKPLVELMVPIASLLAVGALGSLTAFFLFQRQLAYGGKKR